MFKSLLLIIILLKTSYAITNHIEQLQMQFQKEVIELSVFKKHFGTYLEKKCDGSLQCFKSTIVRLKSWNSVKNDNKLKYYLHQKNNKLQYDKNYWENLLKKLNNKHINLNNTQFVSVIDLSKQLYIVTLWDQQTQTFHYIGKDFISSGNINREKEVKFGENHYLKTPAGIFKNMKGWRSDGKKSDDNKTLGYGQKDRYVFYFGKQKTIRYNTFDKNNQKIYDPTKWKLITDTLNFAVHAHQSSMPMGQPNSHGCIRMTDELNRFLDNNSILHKNMLEGDKWIHKYAKEPNVPKYHQFAGEFLVVFDKI